MEDWSEVHKWSKENDWFKWEIDYYPDYKTITFFMKNEPNKVFTIKKD